ncbi:MAG: COR domain-containing protein, partial [Bacteroidota bacterium]
FMVSSELCFCLEQKDYKELKNPTFIIPHYLPEHNPAVNLWDEDDNLHYQYQPYFFHKGLVERLMVRLGRLSAGTALWRGGMFIFHPKYGKANQALILFKKPEGCIYIRTRGRQKQEFLLEIIKELDELLDDGSKADPRPSEKVQHFLALDGLGFVERTKLLEYIENGAQTIVALNGAKLPINQLESLYLRPQRRESDATDLKKDKLDKEISLREQADKVKRPEETQAQTPSARQQRKIARLEKYIMATEEQIDEWEQKRRNAENPNERNRSEQEIKKLEEILEEYESKLELLQSP